MITLAADVGGTFTDLILTIGAGSGRPASTHVDKVSTGARGSTAGIEAGIAKITQAAGLSVSDVDLFVHGFTVGINALLTRAGARAVLIVPQGQGDVLEIGNQIRPRTYALFQDKPSPVIPRAQVIEIDEGIDAFGTVTRSLAPAAITATLDDIARLKPEAVAISLSFSFLNPIHEQALAGHIRSRFPDLPIFLSHETDPRPEEWRRASTTATVAYIGPIVSTYVRGLEAALQRMGFRGRFLLMRSDGGVATFEAALRNPGHLLTSGLSGGVIAAEALLQRAGLKAAVALDVGGTSADLAAVKAGRTGIRRERVMDGQPIRLPTIDVETVSNGGGSIAWVDVGGALRVGPASAGAVPGPACYGMGGTRPTVTDAAVVLGWLAPKDYLGGEMTLDEGLARQALSDHVAAPLNISVEAAAFGVIRVANAALVQTVRKLAVERGLDLRRHYLIPAGGAGPLYGAMIARDLGMAGLLVPRYPGIFAAEGLLAADLCHRDQRHFHHPLDTVADALVLEGFETLQRRAAALLDADGVPRRDQGFRFKADMRHIGQWHDLAIDIPQRLLKGGLNREGLATLFHRKHRELYGHSDPSAPTEFRGLSIEATGTLPRNAPAPVEVAPASNARRRSIILDDPLNPTPVAVFDRASLGPGQRLDGSLLISQKDSTIVVFPGQFLQVLDDGALLVLEGRA
jgi:N-methylhydantoinase A